VNWPILNVIPAVERDYLLGEARPRSYPKGTIVFCEGEFGDTLHLVKSGHVAIKRTLPTGEMGTLLVLGPGAVFGELAVVAPAPRNATVVALDAVTTLSIDAKAFAAARRRYPGVDQILVQDLAGEVRRLSGLLMDALYRSSECRIVTRLLELIEVFDTGGPDDAPVQVPLTQDELAQLAGTARPTVTKTLRPAVEAGELRLGRGRIVVLDPGALRRRLRADPPARGGPAPLPAAVDRQPGTGRGPRSSV
jgi:CRP-like cAMP-binding protein